MIPKTIHAIWLGGPKTDLAQNCRASWARFAPEFEVREWGLDEVEKIGGGRGGGGGWTIPPFVRAALKAKKWAFVSDWLRFVVLEREGGLYFDYDVELVRPLEEGLMGLGLADCEWSAGEYLQWGGEGYAPGAGLSLEKGSAVARQMLAAYESAGFDGRTTVGDLMSLNGVTLPRVKPEVFCPFDSRHRSLRTDETIGIHHYALSWISPQRRVAKWLNWHGLGFVTEGLLRVKRRVAR